jgi:site-specific DNA-methyltransferase (adenine-specific)
MNGGVEMRKDAFSEWETPQSFFEMIDAEFGFTVDVCALPETAKCDRYFSPADDGLSVPWEGICWMNPPYDKSIGRWIEKAYETAQRGHTVVALIQGRSTDTKLWHDYVMRASELRFIRDRLHFGRDGIFKRANISSVLVVFRPYCQGPPTTSSIYNGMLTP